MKDYVVKYGKSVCEDHFLGWRRVVPSEGLTTAVIHSGCFSEEPFFFFRILFFFAGGTPRSGGGVLHNSSNDGQVIGDSSMAVDAEGSARLKSIGVSGAGGFDEGMG
jgi:hypothetical protein